MKKIRHIIMLSVAVLGCVMLSSCKAKEPELLTSSNASPLPTSISQDDWTDSKKYVNLSTGIKMAYVEMGNPSGEVVVLQHGMTDNSRSWSLAAPYFANAGYHVYLPDLRGMGKTEAPDGYYTTVTYATDLEAFFNAMGIDKAIVVGHSLGSFTMQTFALMFPERCSKVVLVSSAPVKDYLNPRLLKVYQNYIEPLGDNEHPSDEFMDLWYECTFKEDNAKEIEFDKFLSNLKTESQVISKQTWKNIIFGLASTNLADVYYDFDSSIPVLVLHGDSDNMAKNEYQEELLSLFHVDKGSYKNYLGVGHNIQFEITKQSSEDIIYWLNNGVLPNNN